MDLKRDHDAATLARYHAANSASDMLSKRDKENKPVFLIPTEDLNEYNKELAAMRAKARTRQWSEEKKSRYINALNKEATAQRKALREIRREVTAL